MLCPLRVRTIFAVRTHLKFKEEIYQIIPAISLLLLIKVGDDLHEAVHLATRHS